MNLVIIESLVKTFCEIFSHATLLLFRQCKAWLAICAFKKLKQITSSGLKCFEGERNNPYSSYHQNSVKIILISEYSNKIMFCVTPVLMYFLLFSTYDLFLVINWLSLIVYYANFMNDWISSCVLTHITSNHTLNACSCTWYVCGQRIQISTWQNVSRIMAVLLM